MRLCSGKEVNYVIFTKVKGSFEECDSFRGILVADASGKSFHRHIRKQLLDAYNRFAHQAQCGGIQGRATDFANHVVRFFFRLLLVQ